MNSGQNDLFRAFIFSVAAVVMLTLVGYLVPRGDDATQGIFRIADSLLTGALGFFAGRATSHTSITSPTDGKTSISTTTSSSSPGSESVTVDPTQKQGE